MTAKFVCLMCLALVAAAMPARARAQDGDVYTVAKLSVDVEAKDAVTAKNEALELAKQQALGEVMRRLAPFNSFGQLPVVEVKDIDAMIDRVSVQRERNSATRYLATLDFSFNGEEVRKLLASKGIPITDQQAEPVAVLPVYIDKGKVDHTGRDIWRTAWNGLDLTHAVVPVRLKRPAPSLDVEAVSSLLGGDVEVFVALRDKYKTRKLVLAVAEATADGGTLTTRLFGIDEVGSMSLTRHDTIYNRDARTAAEFAARVALGVLEGRWKLMQSPAGGDSAGAALTGFDVVVEFTGMREWRDIRDRLGKVPGVQGLDVKSLSARTAQVTFQFFGGPDRLGQALTPRGLSLHGGEGAWVLRSN